jgi:hypothetical protein
MSILKITSKYSFFIFECVEIFLSLLKIVKVPKDLRATKTASLIAYRPLIGDHGERCRVDCPAFEF